MFLKAFPDINWLKEEITKDFSARLGWEDRKLRNSGWPTVTLNVDSKATERTDIAGPFSLFMNINGESLVGLQSKQWKVDEHNFVLSYPGECYDLIIPKEANTFNIHFGTFFFQELINEWTSSNEALLETVGTDNVTMFDLPRRSYQKRGVVSEEILKVQRFYQSLDQISKKEINEKEEELLLDLGEALLKEVALDHYREKRLSAAKTSTRRELVKRLFLAIDYIHDDPSVPFSVEKAAQVSTLSKFHFVRLFKEAFHQTPGQYRNQIRLEKGITLLKKGTSVKDVSQRLGFEHSNAFTKFFKQHTSTTPTKFLESI